MTITKISIKDETFAKILVVAQTRFASDLDVIASINTLSSPSLENKVALLALLDIQVNPGLDGDLSMYCDDANISKLRQLMSRINVTAKNVKSSEELQREQHIETALNFLRENGILIDDNQAIYRQAILSHNLPIDLAESYVFLKQLDLLTVENVKAIARRQKPIDVIHALINLISPSISPSILTDSNLHEYFTLIVNYRSPQIFARTIYYLNKGDLLKNNLIFNLQEVLAHNRADELALILCKVKESNLLSRENFALLASRHNLQDIYGVLSILARLDLLSGSHAQNNFATVIRHNNLQYFYHHIYLFERLGLLTAINKQTNFERLMRHKDTLFAEDSGVLDAIPEEVITADLVQGLLNICEQHLDNPAESRALCVTYVQNFLQNLEIRPVIVESDFNRRQSTHTSSVHESASESARKLLQLYAMEIEGDNLELNIRQISSWVNTQSVENLQFQAAKKCISRLTSLECIYTDAVSQVSIRQLLALIWLGLEDEEACVGNKEDRQQRLIESLYDIQRGYNLSATGVDDGLDDQFICFPGTFNKLVEVLDGIHRDVKLVFITKSSALYKLPIVVREEAQNYLKELLSSEPRKLEFFKENFRADETRSLWDHISSNVSRRLYEEFSSLYSGGVEDSVFTDFIAHGIEAIDSVKLINFIESISRTSAADNAFGLFNSSLASDNDADNIADIYRQEK